MQALLLRRFDTNGALIGWKVQVGEQGESAGNGGQKEGAQQQKDPVII